MFIEERQESILSIIQEKGKITIGEITGMFGISDESARRDLRMLEQENRCKRVHGGAIALPQIGLRPPALRQFENMPIYPTYDRIAKEAVSYIKPGDVVYITGGSFGYLLTRHLPGDLRAIVVTNFVELAQKLREYDKIETYMIGGKMRQSGSVTDTLAADFVSRFHFDVCFLTGAGLTASFGLSNGSDETAHFQRTVLQNSRRKILLLPGSKIGMDAFVKVADTTAFDTLITDWECLEEHVVPIREQGLTVITVPEEDAVGENGTRETTGDSSC